ncbi:hypothetical protein GCM10009540_28280 [Streptomyces turgidiscabies]
MVRSQDTDQVRYDGIDPGQPHVGTALLQAYRRPESASVQNNGIVTAQTPLRHRHGERKLAARDPHEHDDRDQRHEEVNPENPTDRHEHPAHNGEYQADQRPAPCLRDTLTSHREIIASTTTKWEAHRREKFRRARTRKIATARTERTRRPD